MNNDPLADLTPYVVTHLAHSRNRDDIIHWVCNQRNITWDDGALLVNEIEQKNRKAIRKRQSPLLFIISALVVVAGLVWAFGALLFIMLPIVEILKIYPEVAPGVLWYDNFPAALPHLLIGSVLAAGGFVGIREGIRRRMKDLEE